MRRSLKSEGLLATLGVVIGFVVLGALLLFHGSVFRVLGSVLLSVTPTPEEEYRALSKEVLAARVVDLERELAHVRFQAVLYQGLTEEIQRLEELLLLPQDAVVAHGRVLARPPQTHYDSLVLELAADHRVSLGDLVFFEQALLGAVSEVTERSARVALLSRPSARTDARVGDPSGIVILEGLGGGAFTFDVPSDVSVEQGDAVVSASDDRALIAVVVRVIEDPDKTVSTVHARLPVSLAEVRYVSIRAQNPL